MTPDKTETAREALVRMENALRSAALAYAREHRCEIMEDDALWEAMALAALSTPPRPVEGLTEDQLARIIFYSMYEDLGADDALSPRNTPHWEHWKAQPDASDCGAGDAIRTARVILSFIPPAPEASNG